MGAYSPAPVLGPAVHERVMRDVITLTLRDMAQEGHPYRGFLYAGLMIAPDGSPRVLEFNCRLGDWEAPVLLMRLRSDLVEPLEAALAGRVARLPPDWDPRSAGPRGGAGRQGYPGSYRKGGVFTGLRYLPDVDTRVFHAGTVGDGGAVVTGGGQVACVCALGGTVGEAQRRAYERLSRVHFEGMYYRRDIGGRAIARERVRS